jgi:hypothetical protein
MEIKKEEEIILYMMDKDNDPEKIYNMVINEKLIPSDKMCYVILEKKLLKYVNLISEYYLGIEMFNEIHQQRKKNNLTIQKLKEICSKNEKNNILEDKIKNTIYKFILNNKDFDDEHNEILSIYLESIDIDEDYKNQIKYLITKVNNEKIKKTLEIFIDIDSELDEICEKYFSNIIKKN